MEEGQFCASLTGVQTGIFARCLRTLAGVLVLLASDIAYAAVPSSGELADLTLEQLTNIKVTSVSRRSESLADAPASIYVISAEDIRRSGARTLPEALRLAPNLDVARADANQYAISARGFNSTLANKMLVLIDGRTVYSPLFSGVFWEAQDVMLEDIDRIEVIDGPGGTLWGSNAVNGVINIITRSSKDTQGALAAAGTGTVDRAGVARYGGQVGGDGTIRLYAKSSQEMQTTHADGTYVGDASYRSQAGFRADWAGIAHSTTLQGDAYSSDIDQVPGVRRISGANLLGRWIGQLSDDSSLNVQAYVDHTERSEPRVVHDIMTTVDIEVQHSLEIAPGHRFLWGGGYREYFDAVDNKATTTYAFLPEIRDLTLGNIFAQDEIGLGHGVRLIAGLKLEHNTYTGLEYLPNLRLAWKPAADQLLWGDISRAVRTPSRIDRDVFVPSSPPYVLAGGPNFQSEIVDVAEIGYRAQPTPALSYSVTLYHNFYSRLRSLEPTPQGPQWENKIGGDSNGAEAWGTYRVTDFWRLNAGLSLQRIRIAPEGDSHDTTSLPTLGNDPGNWWSVRSAFDIGARHELDIILRHVGALPNPQVPAYNAVDARWGWRISREFELSLVAQNMFDPHHGEWGAAASRAEFDRAVFVKLQWRTP
jgi:iron complex outermembrane receptor protein